MSTPEKSDLSWDAITERLRVERDQARADATYWQQRYERLAHEMGPGVPSDDFEGAVH